MSPVDAEIMQSDYERACEAYATETLTWEQLCALLPERPYNDDGRPSLLTRSRALKLCQAVRDGNYFETSARLAGLAYPTMQRWMRDGDAEIAPNNWARVLFRTAVQKAEAEAEAEAIRGIRAAGDKDWKAHASWVGRRHRGRWSEQYHGGESGARGVVINVGIALPAGTMSTQALEGQVVSVPRLTSGDGDVTAIIRPSPGASPADE